MEILLFVGLLVGVSLWLISFLRTSQGKQRKKQKLNFFKSKRFVSRFSQPIVIAAIITIAIVAGNTVSAQVTARPLVSLKTVAVPEPDNLSEFIKDKLAAIKLGKALFWDMQVGSDGITSCATCHFHAGADNRAKNQIAPGLLRVNADKTANPDTVFDVGGAPNYKLKPEDFPIKTNDVVSSQGVFNSQFIDVTPGSAVDQVKSVPDSVFNVNGTNVRRVEPRNTPSVINSVFNFRNFWDGRAQEIFNGVNVFGLRDANASVVKAVTLNQLESVKVSLNHASLASQAVGPPISSFEMSADGRTFAEIGDKFGTIDQKSHSAGKGKKLLRKLGKKLIGKGKALRPLGKQIVHPQDSVLGKESRWPLLGLQTASYEKLITDAFKPEWWRSNQIIQINTDGSKTFVSKPDKSLQTNEYTLMEYNFPLFFGLAVQMYESTLIADDTPLDRYLEGNTNALTDQQKRGKVLFEGKAQCTGCHNGGELTKATVSAVENERIGTIQVPNLPRFVFDEGWVNIGVRPPLEDVGVGGNDPFGNPLSEPRLALLGTFEKLLGSKPNTTVTTNDLILADGSFKIPGLRNIELTAPYFHNGGYLTLEQVVDFYNRGGDFPGALAKLNLTDAEQADLVAFMKGLTDERVRYEKAPFDHPQLFIPNGHWGDTKFVIDDGTGKAKDGFLEIPAVGKKGGYGTPNFLED
ncbi:cytochrome-c peroxidase [Nostoc sp. FACHB-110]|uniref:cytochrome-c peroxidase n=1 Tax=Nostoc sp. FACHB-110 TaxID=2692834 RepID=UPI00168579DC|nr:cytochrome c peroxidase [Nostoc sp. FACHB-110]MBD2435232.1 cytochrome C peroxidase [Nostoc sp. FACHB-110]